MSIYFSIFTKPSTIEHMYKVLMESKNTRWHALCKHFCTQKSIKYTYDYWIVLCVFHDLINNPFLGLCAKDLKKSVMEIKHLRLDLGQVGVFWVPALPGSVSYFCLCLSRIYFLPTRSRWDI